MMFPEALTSLNRWVCANRNSKVPMQASRFNAASCSDPDTWSDYRTAAISVNDGHYDYTGYVFNDDGIVGIDIDTGYDLDGFMTPLACHLIRLCESYTERSRSGRGFHIIVKGDIPFNGRNANGVEMYKKGRYFIMTGDCVVFSELRENQAALDAIVAEFFSDVRPDTPRGRNPRLYSPTWTPPDSTGRFKVRPTYPKIYPGSRNASLLSLGGALRSHGLTQAQIWQELLKCNLDACEPPLSESEVASVLSSVMKYERRKPNE